MEREQDSVCWWVVDSAGGFSGSVQVSQLGTRAGFILATAEHLWLRRLDELGLEHVERYRLLRSTDSGEPLC